jgi:hypothetical protein
MKKLLLSLVLFLAFAFSVKAETIHNFNAEIAINKDGTINVQKKIQYDFGEVQRHGIYRTIPSIKNNRDGKKFKLDLFDFSVVDENNAPYRFTQTKEGSDIN